MMRSEIDTRTEARFGWNDFATARLEELKQKHGVSDRKDIMTIADAIDLDEKRKS
jgi:hypothetical protein